MDLIFMTGETIKYDYNNEDIISLQNNDFLLKKNIVKFLQDVRNNKCIYSFYSLENGENKYNKYISININQLFVLERVFNQEISEEFVDYFDKYFDEYYKINNNEIDINIIEDYLKNGADPGIYNKNRQTCLHLVCILDRFDIAKLLLNYDANPNPVYSINNILPLHLSVKLGSDNITKLLLEYGADINSKDRIGWTPIYSAAWNTDISNLRTLIEYNADINNISKYKWTPLHVACNSKNNLCNNVELLIKNGAKINVSDDNGLTPLYLACMMQDEEVIKTLIKNGADPNLKTNNWMTSYDYCKKHDYSFLEYIK